MIGIGGRGWGGEAGDGRVVEGEGGEGGEAGDGGMVLADEAGGGCGYGGGGVSVDDAAGRSPLPTLLSTPLYSCFCSRPLLLGLPFVCIHITDITSSNTMFTSALSPALLYLYIPNPPPPPPPPEKRARFFRKKFSKNCQSKLALTPSKNKRHSEIGKIFKVVGGGVGAV